MGPSDGIRSRYRPSVTLGGGAPTERIRAAYGTLADAWLDIGGMPPPEALYAVLSVAGVESSYGNVSYHNWGSIQCGHGPPCGDDCIELGDSHADGTGYRWCYKRYKTARDGAYGLASLLVRRVGLETLSSGDPAGVAAAMKKAGYYELAEEKYAAALSARYKDVLSVMGASSGGGKGDGSGWAVLIIGAIGAALMFRRR